MATKSDFAQKLLQDLRMRKEKMGATQNSSRQSSQTSRVVQGNSAQTSRGSRRINGLESTGSKTGITSTRSNRGNSSRSINIKESSNQMVLYENQQSSKQARDLSMAIAFAFENTGNPNNITASTANPLLNLINRFGRKTEIATAQFPTASHIHITEISKGVQKLNQILRACSNNGFSFNRNSIEIGKELLKGSIDLEESLRMLVNLQESSQSVNGAQKKSHLKLLDEDEDDQDNNDRIAEQWKLDRPKFSFDKPSRRRQQSVLLYPEETSEQPISNSKMVPHKRSTSCVQDLSLSTQVKLNNNSSLSLSTREKGRISNVVAKLMGLEELPLNEDSTRTKSDSKGKLTRKSSKSPEPLNKATLTSSSPPTRDSKLHLKVNGLQTFVASERQQNFTDDKQSKTVEGEIEYRVSANPMEKRDADKNIPTKQKGPQHQRVSRQEPVHKGTEHSKGQQFQKQNLLGKKNQDQQVESIIAPKSKKSIASVPGKGRSTKLTEKVPIKDPPKRRHQDFVPMIDISQKTASKKENFNKEDQSHNLSRRAPQLDKEEKPIEVSSAQKKAIPRKVQRSEIPQKIDVLMARRNSTASQSTRTIKQPATMLRDLKKQMHNKNRSSKRLEEQSNRKGEEVKTGTIIYNESERASEPVKEEEKLENKDEQSIVLNSCVADEIQIQNVQSTETLNDKCDTIAHDFEKVSEDLQTMEQPCALNDEQELKQCDQITDITGDHDESTELYSPPQHEYKQLFRQEQLTEPEKELKEILIKSQQFLSTSEALFKLNIPFSFLHATDHDNVVVAEKKLVLDCAYEMMKRKARRNEVTHHPYTKNAISYNKVRSLDDLVRQLSKDLEMLRLYSGNGSDECDVAASLHNMLYKDFCNKDPDTNCMWDFEWSKMKSVVTEKEDVVKEVERHMLNGLLDEILNDLLVITVSV